LAVGLLGWLGNPLVFAVPAAAALAAVGRVRWRRFLAETDEKTKGGRDKTKDGQDKAELNRHWLWLGVPFVLLIVLGGMLPPIDFDVREYHVQVPKEWFQQGQVTFLPHNVYGNMALGGEMHCLTAMVVADDWWLGALAGKTVIALMAPLTALGLFAAGRRLFSPTAGIVAAVVYISIPWIVHVSAAGLVEGAVACYLFLAVYAVVLARTGGGEQKRLPTPFMLLAGYLAGGAVACKYPAVLFVVLPLAVWIGARNPEKAAGFSFRRWKLPAVFLLAALLGCGLWFGKNWVLTGNPTYPLLYDVFDGRTRTPQKSAQWNAVHRPDDFSLSTLGKDLARVGLRSEWLSPLVFPLAVLAAVAPGRRRLTVGLLCYFLYVIAAWWLLTHRIDRFWIPMLPVLALAAGAGADWSRRRAWQIALIVVLAAGCVSNFVTTAVAAGGYNAYFVRLERLRNDPARVDPWHHYFNTHFVRGRVLLVGEAQVFDLEVPILYNTCFDDCLFERIVKDRSPEEIRAALAERDISIIYVHWGEIHRYRTTGYGFTDFVRPEVFERLIKAEIIEPLPEIQRHSGRAYRVR